MKRIAVVFCTLCLLLSLSPAALAEEDLDLDGSTVEASQAAEGIQDLESEAWEDPNEESAPSEATDQEPPAQEAPAGGNQSPRGLQTIDGSHSVISPGGDPSPGGLNALFAQMQQDLAEQSKEQALGQMGEITQVQQEQAEAAGYLDQVRTLRDQAKTAGETGAPAPELPQEVRDYLDANGLSYGDSTDLDAAVRALQDRQEELGSDIQHQMTQVQDALGRYNANSSGSSVPTLPGGLIGGAGSSGGLSNMFAQMQQDLANQVNAKDNALGYMGGIQEAQREHTEAANYLDQVWELQLQAAEAEKTGASTPELPEEVRAYLDANGLSYGDGTDLDAAARALQDRQEELSTDIQSQMVQVQDAIGRLNETTFPGMQGLSSTTWGQSLFSTQGGVSTGLPPIAASILIGVLLGMALMGVIQRKRTGGREL